MSEKTSENDNLRQIIPTEIRLDKSKEKLSVSFHSGEAFEFTAEFLRVLSPSAEVKGHSEETAKLQWGKSGVIITSIEPVGNYAIRIEFSDGHNTGFYSWVYLHELGTNKEQYWQTYLSELEQVGKSR